MLLSGIYAAEFLSSLNRRGTGVAIFTDNTFHGGDASYYYKGKYSRHEPDLVEIIVDVAQYAGDETTSSAIGLDKFRLKLTGKILESEHGTEVKMTLEGFAQEDSSRRISIELRRLDDLVEAQEAEV